nr:MULTISPECIES: NDMA-dependent alcohol dehydrogenase [unclassified Mycolicibacterium]
MAADTSGIRERRAVRTKAAVLWGLGEKWQVEDVELDPPKEGEVLVKLVASGLCHSDYHLVTGDIPVGLPYVGGHEGAGIVAGVGPGVTDVAEGDSVVLSFLPACGKCSHCARGMTNLCDLGAHIIQGPQLDGTYRFHARDKGLGQMCLLGTFSEYTVVPMASVVKVDAGSPLDRAAVIGCCVPTGYGSVVNTAGVRPGDAVAIMGVGGIGANAVQGAKGAGARYIVAIDPVEYKREKARVFGATHAVATVGEAQALITDLTRGVMADVCVITTDHAEAAYVGEALSLVGRRGKVIVTAIGHPTDLSMDGSLFELTLYEKSIQGSLFGSSNPRHDIPRYLEMYTLGELKLDELITREYTLDEINQGYEDMLAGRNIRGVIRF